MTPQTTLHAPVRGRARRAARAATTTAAALATLPALSATAWAQDIPDFDGNAPAGLSGPINALGGNAKWLALASIGIVFFAGLVVLTLGKIFDHRQAHRIGIGFMLTAVATAIASAVGIGFLNAIR